MRWLNFCVGLPAWLLLLGYFWVRSLPYRTARRARTLAAWLKGWAKAIGKAVTGTRWERPKPVTSERRAWFIWCHNCHKRFGMAVQAGDKIELRIGLTQNRITIDEATASQLALKCRHCGRPVSITMPTAEPVELDKGG